jgi:branched-chain amino acid transport system permease protein
LLTLSLTEGLRVWFGTNFIGAANTIYGILLVLCVIFMPQGVVGTLQRMKLRRRSQAKPVTAKNGVTT